MTNSAVIHGLCVMTLNSNALLAQARPHDDKSSDQYLELATRVLRERHDEEAEECMYIVSSYD